MSIANGLVVDVWNITFNRSFGKEETSQWEGLKTYIMDVELNDDMDKVMWCFEKSGVFSVKFLYRHLVFWGVICRKNEKVMEKQSAFESHFFVAVLS